MLYVPPATILAIRASSSATIDVSGRPSGHLFVSALLKQSFVASQMESPRSRKSISEVGAARYGYLNGLL